MPKLAGVEGNPYRDHNGRFDDSPFDFLKNRGSKTYVSREDNEKKVKALKKEAEKQLKAMRATEQETASAAQAQRDYDEAEHQKRVAAAADAIANLDGTDEAVATGQVSELQTILTEEELTYTNSEIQNAIMKLHEDPYYIKFVLPNYPGSNPTGELDGKTSTPSMADEGLARALRDEKANTPNADRENKNVPILDSVNPTGGLFVDYNPQLIASAQLADNMTTLDQTTGGSPDDIITVYRGVDKEFNQTQIVPGDFITDMKELAESYTGDGNVIELRVRKGDVVDDANEPGGNEYLYIPGAEKKVAERDGTKTKETKNELSKKSITANALDHKIDLVVKNQISARDFPHVYEDLGIDLGDLGCIMMDVEPIDIMESIQPLYDSANIYYGEPDDTHYGIPAMNEAHVTLLYGLLQNGHVWRDKVNEMLMGWTLPELTVEKVSYFDIGKAFAVIALIKKTPELIDGHERLTLLPHVNTFSEYIPHVSLVYVDKTVDVDALVKLLNKQLKGATLVTTGINYGDEPENVEDSSDDYDEPSETSDSKDAEAVEVEQTDTLVDYKAKALQSPENEDTEHFLALEGIEHNHSHDFDKIANSLSEDQASVQLLEQANLDQAVKNLDQSIINAVIEQLQRGNIRAAEELITEAQEGAFVNVLALALLTYGLAMLPMYALQLLFMRTNGAGIWDNTATDPADPDYEFSDDLKKGTRPSAQSHVRTVLKDTTRVINDAYDKEVEAQLQKLVDEKLAAQDEGYDRAELYKIARTRAKKGESLQNIIKAVEAASDAISTKRAKVLSRNEQFRIFTMSQFEADRQFINQTGNKGKAYKKLVSMSGNPCPICNLIIKRTAANPIPFTKNFADLHDELEAEYVNENGEEKLMKLKLNFAPIESGNVHVQCHCRYELLLKNEDGSFLNALEGDQYTLKALQSIDFDETKHPRDKDGKFKTKVGKHIAELYETYPTLKSDATTLANLLKLKAKRKKELGELYTGDDDWWEAYELNGKAEKAYTTKLNSTIDSLGVDLDEVNGLHYEWSGGNGPRGEDGYYIRTPELQENIQNSNILKAQYITQAVLFELGLEKITVYRGEKTSAKHEARGLVSFSTSKNAASSFGSSTVVEIHKHPATGEPVKEYKTVPGNLIEKTVPITAVLTHHFVLFDTEYETEKEVIVNTDVL